MGIDLGRKRHYALRAMVALARAHGSGLRKSREIATDSAVPVSYLPQVLAELVRAGLVTSVAGPRGGYATARPPDEISLLEVVEAVGGPLRSALCPSAEGRARPTTPARCTTCGVGPSRRCPGNWQPPLSPGWPRATMEGQP